jgi:hypothetical protein
MKTILRYLKKTEFKGTVVKPTDHLHFDMWVDADFAGLYGREDDRDPTSAKSRTGYIISLSDWPLIWKSQLQTHLSQSTLEAEYSALSYALKTYLPLKWLVVELIEAINHPALEGSTIRAQVFEDNMGAYYLATNQRITNRTKYFIVKWHWFWSKYNEGQFEVIKCPTTEMRADIFTKMIPRQAFEENRKAIMGW